MSDDCTAIKPAAARANELRLKGIRDVLSHNPSIECSGCFALECARMLDKIERLLDAPSEVAIEAIAAMPIRRSCHRSNGHRSNGGPTS